MKAPLETELALLSVNEIAPALGIDRAPPWAQKLAKSALMVPSRPLARVLARLDRRVREAGLSSAADETLRALGVRWEIAGSSEIPLKGPLLIVANHPGAYDALSLMASIGRSDLAIIAADRPFLRALAGLRPHLLFIPLEPGNARTEARAAAMRRAIRHLGEGGALLHFPAGQIEPDPAFLKPGEEPLAEWQPGTSAFVRATASKGGRVMAAIVAGVHSPRAKRLLVTKLAEKRGITTVAPILQAALPGFRDVLVRVYFSPPLLAETIAREAGEAAINARIRREAQALLTEIDGARGAPRG
ncbi:MAG: 1-acyl-sn-glycerol-3-phosphate acyltransferase [Polyangiaceae bacterium]|nr:1-acyl-sn-glycerol-3-phosphate acyltransferase [Polyangiaceae bacterium]